MNDQEHIIQLLRSTSLSAEEMEWLTASIDDPQRRDQLLQLAAEQFYLQVDMSREQNLSETGLKVWEKLVAQGIPSVAEQVIAINKQDLPAYRIPLFRRTWLRYAAAIIIIFGVGAYLWNSNKIEKPLVQNTEPVISKNDVAPGSNRATLTLSDGRKVELTPGIGSIAETGTTIQNENGRLEYSKAEQVVFNTT